MAAAQNTRCQNGHLAYSQAIVTEAAPGATTTVIMCPTCDRGKCACGLIDITGSASQCKCGRSLVLVR